MTFTPSRVAATAVVVAFLAALPFSVTFVSGDEIADQELAATFDPVAYVDGIWESQLVPTVAEQSVELPTVLTAFEVGADGTADKAQLTEVAEQFGSITVGEAHVYLVTGTGRVDSIDEKGVLTLSLDGYDGPIAVTMYMGQRIPSDETSVRDAVGFIEFGDFKEQTEYGKVASEINKRIVTDVIGTVDTTSLTGSTVSFTGAFGIRTFNLVSIDLSAVTIVPVTVEVTG